MMRQFVPCACGCGSTIINFGRDGQPIRYKVGHNWTPALAKAGAAASVASPYAKQVRSQAGKKTWSDPAYRQRMAESVQRQWADPAFKEKTLSAARRGIRRKWKETEFRNKMAEVARKNMAAMRRNPEINKRITRGVSKRLRDLWRTPEWIAKIKATHANQCGTTRTSKPEKRLRAFLSEIGITFLPNKRFVLDHGYTMPDAYIPEFNLAVFTDGTYWHGNPAKKQRDLEQRTALRQMGVFVFVIDQGQPELPQFQALLQRMQLVSETLKRML